ELWPAEEPLPIGGYLDAGTLAVHGRGTAEVERALLEAAVQEARGRDLRALDVAPLHAGGDGARLLKEGFSVLIEHRTVHIEGGKRPKPPAYAVQSTAPSYTELREYVALDHTEPPSFRIGNLQNEWSAGLLADLSRPFGAILRVDFATIGVTGRQCPWLPEPEAEIDLWEPMDERNQENRPRRSEAPPPVRRGDVEEADVDQGSGRRELHARRGGPGDGERPGHDRGFRNRLREGGADPPRERGRDPLRGQRVRRQEARRGRPDPTELTRPAQACRAALILSAT